jgi:hypothetical protein
VYLVSLRTPYGGETKRQEVTESRKLRTEVETTLDGRLAMLEGSVNYLINSQLGAAQLLAEQVNSTRAEPSRYLSLCR